MTIDYTINWSDDSLKEPFILSGSSADISSTSLTLTGKGYINWGEPLEENLIHLLENFASKGTAPSNPTLGQTWFDASIVRLNVYTDSGWKQLAFRRIDSATAPTGTLYPGDLWYDTTNDLLKVRTVKGTWEVFVLGIPRPGGGYLSSNQVSTTSAPVTTSTTTTIAPVTTSTTTTIAPVTTSTTSTTPGTSQLYVLDGYHVTGYVV